MDERLSLEEFDRVSRGVEEIIVGIIDVDQAEHGLLHALMRLGPKFSGHFDGYYTHIIKQSGGARDPISVTPWADVIPVKVPTAHEAAERIIAMLCCIFFPPGDRVGPIFLEHGLHTLPDDLTVGDLEMNKWVDDNMERLLLKIERMEPTFEYEQVDNVAARMVRERVLVLDDPPKWAVRANGDLPAHSEAVALDARRKSPDTQPAKTTNETPEPDRPNGPRKKSRKNAKKPFCDKARRLSKQLKRDADAGASFTLEQFCEENAEAFGLTRYTAVRKLSDNRTEWDPDKTFFRMGPNRTEPDRRTGP